MGSVNLVLVSRFKGVYGDLCRIADLIRAQQSAVRPVVLKDETKNNRRLDLWLRPTCTISFTSLRRFKPRRGPVFQGCWLPKSTEYTLLRHQGLPVSDWVLWQKGRKPDVEHFGDYVITKPNFGGWGADVRIRRARRLRWSEPQTRAATRLAQRFGRMEYVVQRFVYTGRWPISYRVVTLFGEAIACQSDEASHDRRPLDDISGFSVGGVPVVSSSGNRTTAYCNDPEIIALAEHAHKTVFPDYPLLGFDILREVPSGKLFVCEANCPGNVWTFSSSHPGWKDFERKNVMKQVDQFGAYDIAAEVLAQKALAHAR